MVALLDTYCNTPMAGTAENLARKFEISREEQDKYALRSQQEAKRAQDAGFFADEIVAGRSEDAQRNSAMSIRTIIRDRKPRWKVWRN